MKALIRLLGGSSWMRHKAWVPILIRRFFAERWCFVVGHRLFHWPDMGIMICGRCQHVPSQGLPFWVVDDGCGCLSCRYKGRPRFFGRKK